MYDFLRLSKEEFLASYSYLTEEEYDATTDAYRALSQVLHDWTHEFKKESTSDLPDDDNDFETVTRLIAGFDSCDFDMFVNWMNAEIDRRKNAERDTLLTDLGVTLARCFDNGLFTAPELDALNDMCKIYETRFSASIRQ